MLTRTIAYRTSGRIELSDPEAALFAGLPSTLSCVGICVVKWPEPKVTKASLRSITEQVAARYVHDRSPELMHT